MGVPCLRLLVLRYRVHRYFTAVHGHEDPAPSETRRNFPGGHAPGLGGAPLRTLAPSLPLLHALLEGASVGQAICGAVEAAGSDLELLPHNVWTWFHDWAAEGFFRAVELR